ncbi:glycosyltransferase family 39 protein [Candidatus Woesebacteria bacterium]|nr:glycosyltransferase family 39 protein [Candidatus Woesebacteria bacterium]
MNKLINRIKNIKNIEYYFVSIILILAFFVRLYKINNPVADWHSFRQADTASVSRIYVEEGINLLFPKYHDLSSTQSRIFNPEGYRFVEFPIFNAFHAILASNFQFLNLEVWGRLVSVFSSLFSTYFLFLLGKKFMGKWRGVLAAFFFAFLPFNIYFSRVILPEPMAIAFALSGVWFFVKFLDDEKSLLLYLSGLLFTTSLLIKPFTIFYSIPLIYLLHKKYNLKKITKNSKLFIKLLVFANIVLIPFFAWRAWINQYPAGIPEWKWMFNGDEIRFRPAFWRWIFGERLGKLILGFWGLVPFSFGFLKTKRTSLFNHFFLLGMFLYVIIFATANVRHDYYQTMIIPAICLVLAQGTLYMWQTREFKSILSRSLLIFSLASMFGVGAYQAKEFYKINHPEIISTGQVVNKITPKDALIIAPYNGDTAFLYHTKRRGWPVVDTDFDTLIDRGADYYVSVIQNDSDTLMLMERFKVVEKTADYIILDLHQSKE